MQLTPLLSPLPKMLKSLFLPLFCSHHLNKRDNVGPRCDDVIWAPWNITCFVKRPRCSVLLTQHLVFDDVSYGVSLYSNHSNAAACRVCKASACRFSFSSACRPTKQTLQSTPWGTSLGSYFVDDHRYFYMTIRGGIGWNKKSVKYRTLDMASALAASNSFSARSFSAWMVGSNVMRRCLMDLTGSNK